MFGRDYLVGRGLSSVSILTSPLLQCCNLMSIILFDHDLPVYLQGLVLIKYLPTITRSVDFECF